MVLAPPAQMLTSAAAISSFSAVSRPVVVGLTGSIGMGKSTVAAWFKRCGVRVHDSDECVHRLYASGGAAVAPVLERFPKAVAGDGGVDRKLLSAEVVAAGREESLKTLEKIVHPLVEADRAEFIEAAQDAGEWVVVVDVPLLLETHAGDDSLRRAVDVVWVVSADGAVQRRRVLERPGMTEPKLDAILARQLPDAEKRARADLVLRTDAVSLAPIHAQCANGLAGLCDAQAAPWTRWRDGASRAGVAACVTWDLDDTLWPTFPPIVKAAETLLAGVARELPKAHAALAAEAEASGEALLDVFRRQTMGVAKQHALIAHDLTEIRRLGLEALAAEHGDAADGIPALVDEFVTARSDVASFFFGDTVASLEKLRAAGVKVGSLTNGNTEVGRHDAVARLFDFAVTAAESGAAKPAVAPFLVAAHKAGAHPARIVHVGDSMESDVIGALNCGMRAVLVSRGEKSARPAIYEGRDAAGNAAPAGATPPPEFSDRWVEVGSVSEAVDVILSGGP